MQKMKFLTLFLLLVSLYACGGSDTDTSDANTTSSDPYSQAQEMAAEQLENLQSKNKRDLLDSETLKAMLPTEILGMERGDITSNRIGAAGMEMANVSATYKDTDSRKRITVSINDGMGGNMANMGMINTFTVDREEGSKSTKTISIDGHKAIREFDTESMNGSLSVIFDQSVVQIEGKRLNDIDDLEVAYKALNLRKL